MGRHVDAHGLIRIVCARARGGSRGALGTRPDAGKSGAASSDGSSVGRGRRSLTLHSEALVVALASGKGGTGKSFLTTNVAIGLHRAGRRVVVVDCDFGLANAHLLFGVNPRYT